MPIINFDINNLDHVAEYILLWIGFGTVIGLAAKAIMPGRDPGGSIVTVILGILGSLFGCGFLQFWQKGADIKPLSMQGFLVGIAGAFLLLTTYRLLGGYYFEEGEGGNLRTRRRRRVRRYVNVD